MSQQFLPGTEIEIVREAALGRIRFALFDFDGTISILREGWQAIMAPVCVEMICGDTTPTPDIEQAVHTMIDETTGIQTIFQMERLVEMVRAHGLVPEDQIQDAAGYKQVYLDRLMVPVRERLERLASGALTREQACVAGAHRFLELIRPRVQGMYVFSGTDQDDVRNECAKVGATTYFDEIWGAIPSTEDYSKEKVIRDLIARHDLHGTEVLAIGDGPVELRNVKDAGGIALGVCSDEAAGHGWDMSKRERLIRAGADILVPDFREADRLIALLFPGA